MALRPLLLGFSIALLFGAIILGSFALTIQEGKTPQAIQPSSTITGIVFPSVTLVSMSTSEVPLMTPEPEATHTPFPLTSISPSSTPYCPLHPGWAEILVQPGDTLEMFAQAYRISVEELAQMNCLVSETLLPNTTLYVPYLPSPLTPTSYVAVVSAPLVKRCSYPIDWVPYIIQQGDTLYLLSLRLGTTVGYLQAANCLGNNTLIWTGQLIYLPFLPPLRQSSPTFPVWLPPVYTPIYYPTWTYMYPSPTPVSSPVWTATSPPIWTPAITPGVTQEKTSVPTSSSPSSTTVYPPIWTPSEPVIDPGSPTVPVPTGSPAPSQTPEPYPPSAAVSFPQVCLTGILIGAESKG